MRINSIPNSTFHRQGIETQVRKTNDTEQTPSKVDRIEISSSAYEAFTNGETLTATSGNDILEITSGDKENTFIIHFDNSGLLNRTVSRGYITVNGTTVELSDDVKNQLTSADQQAQKELDFASSKRTMENERDSLQRQGEGYKKMVDDSSRAIKIATKMSKGYKVTPAEEKELLNLNPQLYAMSKMAAQRAEQQGKKTDKIDVFHKPEVKREINRVSWSASFPEFEFEPYDVQFTLEIPNIVQ